MFTVPQTENGTVFRVACEGRVINDELEQRAAVFATAAQFWEVGDHEWQINGLTSRASYEAEGGSTVEILGLDGSHPAWVLTAFGQGELPAMNRILGT